MASTKGRIVRLLSAFALERAVVQAVQPIGGFRRLELRWSGKPFAAGAKVQLLLPSNEVRTFSPIRSAHGMDLLGWKHGDGPGSRWLEDVRAGDELPFVGPQRSLKIDPGPVVLIGDETSVAVAAAFARERPGQAHAVIQATDADDVRQAAASVGLDTVDVASPGDTAAVVNAVRGKLSLSPSATIALTGGSELVVAVRDTLRGAGISNIKTKAYWIPGRAGLD